MNLRGPGRRRRKDPPVEAPEAVVVVEGASDVGTFSRLADWRIVGNAEGNRKDLVRMQDYVWEHSGRRGPRPSTIAMRPTR